MPEVSYQFEVYSVPEAYRDQPQHVLARNRSWLRMVISSNDEITNEYWARKTWSELSRAFPLPYYYIHCTKQRILRDWINEEIVRDDFAPEWQSLFK